MITAAIIAVGSELMRGKIDDTNSTFFTRWFEKLGIKVKYRVNVADIGSEIVSAMRYCHDADILITTGGLGPTKDDLTRIAAAEYAGKELVFFPMLWKKIEAYLKTKKYPHYESNKQQAYLWDGVEVMDNSCGTAPGLFYKKNRQIVALLPGPPNENRIMAENQLLPRLEKYKLIQGKFFTDVVRVYRIGESGIADLFAKQDDGYFDIGYYFSNDGYTELHFRRFSEDGTKPSDFDKNVKACKKLLTDNAVFFTEDKPIEQIVYEALLEKKKTVSFAESCTGGKISSTFVKTAGVSQVYAGGVVSYTVEMKQKILGVTKDTIAQYGVVSAQTVKEMARGIKNITGSNIALSVSGTAGPGSDAEGNPAGLVWFGLDIDGTTEEFSVQFSGMKREQVIQKAVNQAFIAILQKLK
ncbi:MAG: CinA family nicotinamide mononucleotide deamidase-related protein [Spirochaetales bacterium]|nr:CinA family nicotinamide mononucleotide deamidase-related protein [Spirochaetales bacterium]